MQFLFTWKILRNFFFVHRCASKKKKFWLVATFSSSLKLKLVIFQGYHANIFEPNKIWFINEICVTVIVKYHYLNNRITKSPSFNLSISLCGVSASRFSSSKTYQVCFVLSQWVLFLALGGDFTEGDCNNTL